MHGEPGTNPDKIPPAIRKFWHRVFPPWTNYLRKALAGCDSILDLGCGNGIDSPMLSISCSYSVGVDAFKTSLKQCRTAGLHSEYIHADMRQIDFKNGAFDAVLLLRVLEHMDKDEGREIIQKCMRWASRKVIIFTPNGFIPRGAIDGNPFQVHRAGWVLNDFIASGFKVYGINGWKKLRGEGGYPRFTPYFLWGAISDITQLITLHMPGQAFQLLAIKSIEKRET